MNTIKKITKKNIFEEAQKGNLEVLKHPLIDILKDNGGETPLHKLVWRGGVTLKWLKEKYPWFKLGNKEIITKDLISEILNTPNAYKFINTI